MRRLYCLLVAGAIFETGCPAHEQAQNSDPMLQRLEQDWKVHGEVGAAYGEGHLPNSLTRVTARARFLIQKTDRERITIKISFARADGGDDDKDDVENVQDRQQNESDQHQT